jgi:phytoene dehydrogenase-like protein
MAPSKKIIVIGAGISGLSAGIYARLNGFDVRILEAGTKTGGVCASWERSGYYVNGSIHWLVGSAPGSDLHQMWRQLGVIEDNTFHVHSSFIEYRDLEGETVHFYTDVDKLEKHLLELSPKDEEAILEFTKGIRTIAEARFPMDRSFELFNAWDWTKFIMGNFSAVMAMGKFNTMSVRDFAQQFQSPVLRAAFENFWSPDMSMTFFLMQLAYASIGSASYPLGGSGKFVEKLEQRYRSLGGDLHFNQKVDKILVENDRAIGVRTTDGTTHFADYVISACDGHTVLFDMLEGRYVDEKTKDSYQTLRTFPSLIYFSAGFHRTFEEVPPSIIGLSIPLIHPVKVGSYTHERATFQIYNFDPTLAPEGKTLMTAMLDTDYAFWKNLHEESETAYRAERARICEELLASLEQQFPGLRQQVEFMDTATPITYRNWTGNHKGSYEGWLPTPEAARINLPTHFKGLDHFYMAGHWVTPGGGMPPAAYSGRNAVQLICREEKKHFETSELD